MGLEGITEDPVDLDLAEVITDHPWVEECTIIRLAAEAAAAAFSL